MQERAQGDYRPWLMALCPGFSSSTLKPVVKTTNTGGLHMKNLLMIGTGVIALGAMGVGVSRASAPEQAKEAVVVSAPELKGTRGTVVDKAIGSGPELSTVPAARKKAMSNSTTKATSKLERDDVRSRLSYTFSVEDQNGEHPIALTDSVMPSGMDMMELWSGCYEELLIRRPEFVNVEGEVLIDVTLLNDKEQGWMTMFNWHFSNQKLAAPGFVIPEDNTKDEDVVWAINKVTKFLALTKEDYKGRSKSILGKSVELRNLIHWFGDIHQPLHVIERYSE
jgi:hypothetical protein